MLQTVRALFVIPLLCLSGVAPAVPRPAVVELFTSQGCSSCPPADALVGELARRSDVIALAFHVDYWDDLGWRDRFELPLAAQRQQRYVQTLGLSSAFTPQLVIDGRRSFVGSDRRSINAALLQKPVGTEVRARMVQGNLVVELGAGTQEPFDVTAAAYLPRADSRVDRGENAGRILTDFNIVLAFVQLGIWQGSPARFAVPLASFPNEATQVAILLQRRGQGEIVGAQLLALR